MVLEMTREEAITRVRTGNFNNGHGFDMQLMVDSIGVMREMLKTGYICEVVRCKECIEYKEWGKGKICMRLGSYYGERTPNDFCSLGIKMPLPELPKEEIW
jgi:hypothetical protein